MYRNQSKFHMKVLISFCDKNKTKLYQNKANVRKNRTLSFIRYVNSFDYETFRNKRGKINYSKAFARIDIGCSQDFEVDISICHLQVSQSVTT